MTQTTITTTTTAAAAIVTSRRVASNCIVSTNSLKKEKRGGTCKQNRFLNCKILQLTTADNSYFVISAVLPLSVSVNTGIIENI